MWLPNIFSANHPKIPYYNSPLIHQNLVHKLNGQTQHNGPKINVVFRFLQRLTSGKKIDGGSRTVEEEKLYSWLYALAQSEKDLVYEYVRSTERGLSFAEADRRLKESGPNIPLENTFPKWWNLLWIASFHPFNIILLFLSVISYITSDSPNGCIMLILVFISVSFRFYQEYSSSKAAMKLAEFVRCPIKVQRCAGRIFQTEVQVKVDQKEVVPGDIVIVEPGDLFPGDVRLLESKHLVVSQSSLTGESDTTEKTAYVREDNSTPLLDLKNICFMGTSVVSGSGTGLVISTGLKTYLSTIFSKIGKKRPPDDFEKGIRHISYVLISVMLVVVTVIVLSVYFTSHDLSKSILFGISVASALTPQMLPLIVNTGLAKGALAMAKDRCIVKSLTAIRDMGSMDIICIDKTGTLTVNFSTMVNYFDSWGSPNETVLHFGFLNAYFQNQNKYPLDDAIMAYAYTNGYKFKPSKWNKIDEIPFDFTRRRVSVILETKMSAKDEQMSIGDRVLITKGALEDILSICSFIERVDEGRIFAFTKEDYRRITELSEKLSNEGYRVLGLAMKQPLPQVGVSSMICDKDIESNMVFVGLISFFDPPKDSAKEALWRLAEKGVKAKVLTGDTLSLAIRICKEVGIKTTHVITGPDLESLDTDSFHETVKRSTVFARLTPSQKLRVVQSLQTMGDHVVGFLGDGVNDSLALDAANVGISVDSGASMAKDFANIILLEKDLNVLVAGVEQGRLTFGNTMKYIKMSVIANLGSIISLLIATLIFGFEPLTPMQLLTQNILYNLGQIAIPWDKMEDVYVQTPQRWSLKGLATFTLWNGPLCSASDIATLLFLLLYYKVSRFDFEFFRSAWFVEGLLMQTLIIHLIRTEKIPFIQEVASWPVVCSTVVISTIGIVIPYTTMGNVLGLTALPLSYFGFLVVLFLGYFSFGQIIKRGYILVFKTWL
ncbi:uncharacterized protein LOC107827253 isoform X1 [Nicotiana tabacum]|uniref:Magnesium-transporting ATPase, P-type 1 n=3 Tax=Nicotiana TaxID=4085 RepID=A0A1S4D8P4_TOBAC|nr:PREDICTED: calcium-transporting ATPase 1-like [Nicotiana sylvestris]XP_016509835.1 PREDICTED: magnesium-transporting ATPase, P-type 1-like [Nicotiana tabacum]